MGQTLKFATCSGANEHTSIVGLVTLSTKFPLIEWGVQVSGKKASEGTMRWAWINNLHRYLLERHQIIKIALHVNTDWAENFTRDEDLDDDLFRLLSLKDAAGEPFFKRVQLNFRIGRMKAPDEELLRQRISYFHERGIRFIFQYNDENKAFIHRLYEGGLRDFYLLYDSSHGEGILAPEWKEPVFQDESILQGYAGGLSPENVVGEVMKIRRVLPGNGQFYIDAEGKLKDATGHLSLARCEAYVIGAQEAMMRV